METERPGCYLSHSDGEQHTWTGYPLPRLGHSLQRSSTFCWHPCHSAPKPRQLLNRWLALSLPSASAGFLGWWVTDLVTCPNVEWRADYQGFHWLEIEGITQREKEHIKELFTTAHQEINREGTSAEELDPSSDSWSKALGNTHPQTFTVPLILGLTQ